MIIYPGDIAAIDSVVCLPNRVLPAYDADEGVGNVIYMHVLMKCKSISTDNNRLAFFDPVYPREVPTNLSQHSLHRTIRGGWLDDDCREFFAMVRFEIDIIRRDLVACIIRCGAPGMCLIGWEVIVLNAIRAGG